MTASIRVTASVAAVVIAACFPFTAVRAGDPALVRGIESAQLAWGPCPAFMPESCALTVLHGDPTKPAADVFFKLAAHSKFPAHWHHSAERMVLVAGELSVQYDGQKPIQAESGDYLYGPPGVAHWGTCTSDVDCVLFIAFTEPVDAFVGKPAAGD